MSNDRLVDVAGKLDLLKERFRERAVTEVASVVADLGADAGVEPSREQLVNAYRTLHRLAGSAGTFGFQALGNEARSLEVHLKPFAEEQDASQREQARRLTYLDPEFLGRVRGLAQLLVPGESAREAPEPAMQRETALSEQPEILVVDPDVARAESLATALAPHGFTVHCRQAPEPTDLPVSAIIVRDGTLSVTSQLARSLSDLAPLVFIGPDDSFDRRYALAALGGDGFAPEPVDVPALADSIERLINERHEAGAGRVLVVDDDPELLEHYALVLEDSGLEVWRVGDPSTLLGALSEFRPDIVLMDVQMGAYNGPTLARMLRFDPEWVGLQIIFLSSEEDREFQFGALSEGGDDFLTKPVSDRILVQAAKVRCYRARQLDKLASRDSLTGLLKHSVALAEAVKEHARCQRLGETSVLAMLDLDHFKQVNDRHGHRVGDLVIKGLANLLRHRLRKTDTIGRYGGEEFIVVLPDCSVGNAVRSLQEICHQMSQIRFGGATGEFSVTLSVGLAALDRHDSAEKAIEAADRALYQRKAAGRNGVTCDAGHMEPDQDSPVL